MQNKIQLQAFVDLPLTVFESVVYHLKEDKKLRFRKIAKLLNRDERNIWTVYHRALRKKSKSPKPL